MQTRFISPDIIKAYRDALGLTQAEIASRVGISQPQWHRWENGGCKGIAASHLENFMAANPVPEKAA